MNVSALIPAKGFTNAKHRLSPLLGAGERELLAEIMFRDVLSQVVSVSGLDATFVVTGNLRVAEIAVSLGAQVIQEKKENGETEAVTYAVLKMKKKGMKAVLVLPADIPLLSSSDIDLLLDQVSGQDSSPFALLVPSHDHMGTNALLLSPPDLIEFRFGYDSFSHHLGNVAAKGVKARVWENERIGLDIDEPKDLKRFLSLGGGSGETNSKLLQMGVIGELPPNHRSGSL